MKRNFCYILLILSTFACTSEQPDNTPSISKSKSNAIDSLGNRYLALGRFSGAILIQKDGNNVYEENFGLADYTSNRKFSAESQFKINASNLEEAGLRMKGDPKDKPTKHLVTGYRYHNYRGNGLELEAVAIPPIPGSEQTIEVVSAKELAQVVNTQAKQAIDFSGYLKTDGFSYAVQYKPVNQMTIIVLSNRRHPVADEIVKSINRILAEEKYQLPIAREPYPIDTTLLLEYEGPYELNEQVKFEVEKSKDSLFVLLGPNKVALIPQSANQFYMLDMDASMRFERDTLGTISKVILLNGFIESDQVARRIE